MQEKYMNNIKIRQLNSSDNEQIKKILLSRNKIFSNHYFNFEEYHGIITSDIHYKNNEIINLGLFEDDVLERFAVILLKEDIGITSFLCSMKNTYKENNENGWHKNYNVFVNKIFETYIENNIKKIYYLSPVNFNDETENKEITNFSKFEKKYFILKSGGIYNGPDRDFVNKYVIGDCYYTEDLYIKQFIFKE